MGELRREVALLRRPAALQAAVACVLVAFVFIGVYEAGAASQWSIVTESQALAEARAASCTAENGAATRCEDRAAANEQSAADFAAEQTARYGLATPMRQPLAAGGVAAGLVATLPGLLVLAGFGAAHVAGEWGLGTVRQVLAHRPRRWRFVAAKFVSTWLAGIGLLAVLWVALALSAPISRALYDVPPAPSTFHAWSYTFEMVARALVVLAAAAAGITAIGVLIRNPLGALGAAAAGIFASLAATASVQVFTWSPAYWVAAWMKLDPGTAFADHVWADRFPLVNPDPLVHPDPIVGLIGLIAATVLALGIAHLRLTRFDVGG